MQRGFSLIELVIVLSVIAGTSVVLSYSVGNFAPDIQAQQCKITEQEAQQKVMEQLYYDEMPEFCP